MLNSWIWALCALYFVFGLYNLFIQKKVMRLFAKHFPDENRRYFANLTFNEKRMASLQFLWDKSIDNLFGTNEEIARFRSHGKRCFVAFILLIFIFPILVLAIMLIQKRLFH